jgi:hypothetical protein
VTFAVFFPSLMGFGILVSGALIIADAVHRVLPNQGKRRRYRLASGAYSVVSRSAAAAGRRIEPPDFLMRSYRSRLTYLGVSAISGLAVVVIVSAGTAAYRDVRGLFFESPWISGLTIGFAVACAVVAAVGLVLAAAHRRSPAPLRWLVRTTPAGRLHIPPDSLKGVVP